MHFLPKANPLYEQISADKVVIPEILEKLGNGHFTGYLSYTSTGFEAYCIFAKGKLICAISTEDDKDKTGFEAITLLFDKIFSSGGEINVYRMTADLAMCAHALVLGKILINGDEVRQVDVKSLLAQLKNQDVNGVVHFYTSNRYAMMFYKNGLPIGFYNDGSRAIETTPDESRKVAALPGARIIVRATRPVEELMHYDLLQMVNLTKLWTSASSRQAIPQPKELPPQITPEAQFLAAEPVAPPAPAPPALPTGGSEGKLAELVEDLQEVAMAYLSREGKYLIERVINDAGGNSVLLDSGKIDTMLAKVEDEARVIDSHARIDEMIDLMRSEIAGRLAV
jgi:hypothetical protein